MNEFLIVALILLYFAVSYPSSSRKAEQSRSRVRGRGSERRI